MMADSFCGRAYDVYSEVVPYSIMSVGSGADLGFVAVISQVT